MNRGSEKSPMGILIDPPVLYAVSPPTDTLTESFFANALIAFAIFLTLAMLLIIFSLIGNAEAIAPNWELLTPQLGYKSCL